MGCLTRVVSSRTTSEMRFAVLPLSRTRSSSPKLIVKAFKTTEIILTRRRIHVKRFRRLTKSQLALVMHPHSAVANKERVRAADRKIIDGLSMWCMVLNFADRRACMVVEITIHSYLQFACFEPARIRIKGMYGGCANSVTIHIQQE